MALVSVHLERLCWGRCCFVGLIVDSITTNHATRLSLRRRSMMPVSGLRLDPPVPVPDHVVVEHVDEPVHRDAREAALVEELLLDPAEEPFRGRMKVESVYPERRDEHTRGEGLALIDEYVHWYSHDRIKQSLGWMSPVQYRLSHGLAA